MTQEEAVAIGTKFVKGLDYKGPFAPAPGFVADSVFLLSAERLNQISRIAVGRDEHPCDVWVIHFPRKNRFEVEPGIIIVEVLDATGLVREAYRGGMSPEVNPFRSLDDIGEK
jgi:hypothetical protein